MNDAGLIEMKDNPKILSVGDMAPDFELIDLEGKKQRLSDYRGEGVFLNFWGTWSAPSKREMPNMEKLHKEFNGGGVHILAVNIKESDLKVSRFKDHYGLTFPIAIDTTESVREKYNISELPTTFLINKDGRIEQIISREMDENEMRSFMGSIQPQLLSGASGQAP